MKEMKLTFGIGAKMGSSFAGTFGKAGELVKGLNQELVKMNKSKNDTTNSIKKLEQAQIKASKEIKNFGKEALSSGLEMTKIKNRMKEVEGQIKSKTGNTKALKKEYIALQDSLKKTTDKYFEKKNALNESKNSMARDAEAAKKLAAEYTNLEDKISKTEKAISRAEKAKSYYTKGDKIKDVSGKVSSAGTKALGAGTVGMGAVGSTVYTAIKHQSAFADVKKQFNFEDKSEEEKFKEDLIKIVTEKKLAVPIDELYAMAASAGQSGLKQDEALPYIELAAKMGIAFNTSRDAAAESMFQMKNAFNLTLEDLTKLTDQINYLGNTTGAKAADITEFVGRIGNIGKIAGLSEAQIAGLGATLIEQGMSPEIAATGGKKLMLAMTKGFKATAEEKEAFNILGLDPKYMAVEAQKDAEATMTKIFQRLGKVSENKRAAVMKMLFGEEGIRAGAGLTQNMEKFGQNMQAAQDKNQYHGSVDKEANTRGETIENKFVVTKARFEQSRAKMGELLFPEVEKLVGNFNVLLDKLTLFQKENPEAFSSFVKSIAYGSAALLGLGATFKILAPIGKGIGSMYKFIGFCVEKEVGLKVVAALGKGKVALAAAGKAVWAFGASLLANPITWYVAGIMAIVAAGYLIYKNWDYLSKKFTEWGEIIMEFFKGIGDKIKGFDVMFQPIRDKLFGSLKEGADSIKDAFKSSLDWLIEKLEYISSLKDKAFDFVGKTWDASINFVKSKIPGFAEGGMVSSPTLAWVGEGGSSESIIPHDGSQRSLSLWEKTGKLIGAYENKDSFASNPVSFTYAPVVNATDATGVKEVLERDRDVSFRKFEEYYDRMMKDRRRRGYGR